MANRTHSSERKSFDDRHAVRGADWPFGQGPLTAPAG